jgi:hypothetical protein
LAKSLLYGIIINKNTRCDINDMTIEQTVEIPADHRRAIEVPPEIPAGTAKITLSISPKAKPARLSRQIKFDPRLKGAVDPAMYSKGEIKGDIIGPFYDEWEKGH